MNVDLECNKLIDDGAIAETSRKRVYCGRLVA